MADAHGGHLSPPLLLATIDAHAAGVGQWLKVAGMGKAAVLQDAIEKRIPAAGAVALEFGAFVGYTSVRLAALLSGRMAGAADPDVSHQLPASPRSVSLEIDCVHQVVTRCVLDMAGLSSWGEVWGGQVRDLGTRSIEEFGGGGVSLLFMDHRGTRFHEDVKAVTASGSMAAGGCVVADNVLNPGAPLFLWAVTRAGWSICDGGFWAGEVWSLQEFMMEQREDWMVVLRCLGGTST